MTRSCLHKQVPACAWTPTSPFAPRPSAWRRSTDLTHASSGGSAGPASHPPNYALFAIGNPFSVLRSLLSLFFSNSKQHLACSLCPVQQYSAPTYLGRRSGKKKKESKWTLLAKWVDKVPAGGLLGFTRSPYVMWTNTVTAGKQAAHMQWRPRRGGPSPCSRPIDA